MNFDFLDDMVPHQSGIVKGNTINFDKLSADANRSNNLKQRSRNIPDINSAIDKVTDLVRKTGIVPEKFPASTDTVPVTSGQGYLASALEETRNRLSRYYGLRRRLA